MLEVIGHDRDPETGRHLPDRGRYPERHVPRPLAFLLGDYYDPSFERFGTLRVFNDDTLSLGAIWPLHPHQDNEVVTYCAGGEFRHADERGKGGVLKKGWIQHTTVGRGMWHSEINNRPDEPMRFIQKWFLPAMHGLYPSVEQKAIEQKDRTGLFLPLISNTVPGALRIMSWGRSRPTTGKAACPISPLPTTRPRPR
jgi:redox-sensitive bicupin YhaK (pirin superfamily)